MLSMEELIHVYQCRSTHVDMERYYTLEKQGLVNIKKHPDYPLYLLNYTPRAQYKRRWCHELIHARGLVISKMVKLWLDLYQSFSIIMK